jgi:hypothetical protein
VVVCLIFLSSPCPETHTSIETKEGAKRGGSRKVGAVVYPEWKVLKSFKDRCRPKVGRVLRINLHG